MELAADPQHVPANSTIVRSKHLQRLSRALGLAERLSPRLAGRLAGSIFCRPRRHPQPGREVAWREAAQQLAVPYAPPVGADRRAPKELALLSWGQGPTVLLMHGWEGRASQMGAFADPLVRAGFRAVALDAPAHGRSGGKTSSMVEFAAGVLAVQQEFGPIWGVVGHSLGSAASAFALGEGFAPERLAFVAPPFDLDVFFELFIHVLGLQPGTRDHMIRGYERRFQRSWDSIRRASATDRFPQPLLVAHDILDPETPFAGAQAVVDTWQNAQLLATKGLGHRRILRDKRVIAAVVEHMRR